MGAKEAGSARERFVLAEDLRLLLEKSSTIDPGLRPQIQLRVRAAERELALFDAASAGIRGAWEDVDEDSLTEARASALTAFAQNYRTGAMLAALIDPRPGLVMADVNPACERATGMARTAIVGKRSTYRPCTMQTRLAIAPWAG